MHVLIHLYIYQFIVLFTVVAQGIDVEIICDVNGTDSDTHWRVNGSSLVSRNYLFNGKVRSWTQCHWKEHM